MSLSITELSEQHRGEIARAAQRALSQWAKDGPAEPARVVQVLERVLLFLKQNGGPTRQADHVTSLAFAWGEQVAQSSGWRWMNVSDDGGVNPGLVSPDGAHACLPVDVVAVRVMQVRQPTLSALYRRIVEGPLPAAATPGPVLLE